MARTSLRPPPDLLAAFLIVLISLIAAWNLVVGGTVVGMDAATFFYPSFSYLGRTLRSGQIPEWNPFLLSGAPFAADLQSGWMYLPAMLLFALAPLALAAKGYLLFHLLLAGLATYTLSRLLGMSVVGATFAAVAYEYTGITYGAAGCCFYFTALTAWLPLTLVGAELALRSSGWARRVLSRGISGLALSQVMAISLGQSTYYALLVLGGYITYRTLVVPPETLHGVRRRVSALATHGTAVLVFGFGLAAAGLLPRVEFSRLSILANGYSSTGQLVVGGWGIADWLNVFASGRWYAGVVPLVLALVAFAVAGARYATPFWATLSIGALILSGQGPTPLHWLLNLLPLFEHVHFHYPERVMTVFFLGPALLSGATVSSLPEMTKRRALLAPLLAGGVGLLLAWGANIPLFSLALVLMVAALLMVYALNRTARLPVVTLLLLLLVVDLLTAGQGPFDGRKRVNEGLRVDLNAYYAPRGASQFLKSTHEEELFRFFGYDQNEPASVRSYVARWTNPQVNRLVVNNRSLIFGLHDIQGYNPIRLARYDEYMRALNRGRIQGYRHARVLWHGLDSPLLDLLNVRYTVLSSAGQQEPVNVRRLSQVYPTVYDDGAVRVLERPQALPRAWIVHRANRVAPEQALKLLAGGKIDPRQLALIEQEPPPLRQPDGGARGQVSIVEYQPDQLRLRTTTSAPGLLMLSEIYYPAWKAYIDSQPAQLMVADYILRAIPVPAGKHEVVLRYESTTLRVGMLISLVFCVAVVAAGAISARGWWIERRARQQR